MSAEPLIVHVPGKGYKGIAEGMEIGHFGDEDITEIAIHDICAAYDCYNDKLVYGLAVNKNGEIVSYSQEYPTFKESPEYKEVLEKYGLLPVEEEEISLTEQR